MAIRITEDGVVNYENSPDINRKLFPNLNTCGKEIDKLAEEINGKAPAVFSTASGSTASFDNGADDMRLKSCVVSFGPIQEGTGDPSPENVRPISGRTGLTVSHSGSDTGDPTTISVNWQTEAGTVYGAALDVVSGKLVVDRVKCTMGGGNLNRINSWYSVDVNNQSWGCYLNNGQDIKQIISDEIKGSHFVSDKIKDIGVSYGNRSAWTGGISFNNGVFNYLGIRIAKDVLPMVSSASELHSAIKSYLNANPIEFVFQITPTEIQLTPQEITTLLGTNNIWSDGGDISVEYPADTKTYIDAFSIKTVEVSGQTPVIVAEEYTRYICGEVTSLDFTPCASGICDIRFTTASISTVLTLPQTVKFPGWFDPTALEANTTYEINVMDGIYGAVMSWA